MSDVEWVGLADAVRAVRGELGRALEEGEGKGVRFEVGPVELEFLVEVTSGGTTGGGANVWVLRTDGTASRERTRGHTLRVTLNPVAGGEGEDGGAAKPLVVNENARGAAGSGTGAATGVGDPVFPPYEPLHEPRGDG
jgi:hypothetical protein